MANEQLVQELVEEVLKALQAGKVETRPVSRPSGKGGKGGRLDVARDYPLGTNRPDLVKTPTGKPLDEVTLEAARSGRIMAEEIRITPEVLELQAQVAEGAGREQFAQNLRRAAELTKIADDRILEIYNALRPYRSTRDELLAIADELDGKYGAKINAAFVREAAEVYERRGRLRED